MKRFEHKIVNVTNSNLESVIKKYENDNWEVAGITQNIGEYKYKVILKRIKFDLSNFIRKEIKKEFEKEKNKNTDTYKFPPILPNVPYTEPNKGPLEYPWQRVWYITC